MMSSLERAKAHIVAIRQETLSDIVLKTVEKHQDLGLDGVLRVAKVHHALPGICQQDITTTLHDLWDKAYLRIIRGPLEADLLDEDYGYALKVNGELLYAVQLVPQFICNCGEAIKQAKSGTHYCPFCDQSPTGEQGEEP